MKQTAVEWLITRLPLGVKSSIISDIEQAKEIEKQQIIDAYWEGCSNWDNDTEAEQYYNEQFKNK
jgi:hypothetical protein